MENRDFIITSSQAWDIEIGSTIKNTALELSKRNRVMFVSTPMDLATRLRNIRSDKTSQSEAFRRRMDVLQGKASPVRKINDNLWVVDCPFAVLSINKLPAPLFDFFNRINNRKIGHWIVKQARALNFNNYIHLIDTDLFRSRYLKEYIRPSVSIYYRRDYIIGVPYWRKHGPRMEEGLTREADIVLANSSYFAQQLRPFNPNTYVLNTGVNLQLYDSSRKWPMPKDMERIPSPIIGYTGAIIASRLNGDLLFKIAHRLPQFSFVFVGPEDYFFSNHEIHRLHNTYFLGRKEIDELPQYIQHFDVCINPQEVNPITDGNYPLKIDEYLAMGKPVVATSTHTMRDVFASHTHLATSDDEWIKAVQQAVNESADSELSKERIAFAHTHSWENSVKTIYRTIDEFEKR